MIQADRGGVGVPEDASAWDVFVSYASADVDAVIGLVVGLRKAGLSVWWDRDRIDTFDGITGRFTEILGLHSWLASDKTALDSGRARIRPPVAVVGIGGVGNTMLVQEYVNQFIGHWPVVIKINAEHSNSSTHPSHYAQVARTTPHRHRQKPTIHPPPSTPL